MPTLTDEIKTFIVKGLACYDTPSQVAEAVKVNFDIEISRQHVYAYDPDSSQQVGPRWKDLHAATRQAFLRENGKIGIAHRAVRLRRLDRLASRCERNSVALALRCFEIAAKETGGMYEKRKGVPSEPAAPHPVAVQAATPQPAAIQPTPQPSAPPPVVQQPSMPERAAPQPQATLPARAKPLPSVPLPVMPQPDMPAPPAPQPLAVLAQPPQPPALSEGRPLTRGERYLAYVRDSNARARAAAAQALVDSGQVSTAISTVPPAS
jgi:hypothetical protein